MVGGSGSGEVEEEMSEFNTMNESSRDEQGGARVKIHVTGGVRRGGDEGKNLQAGQKNA